MSDSQNPESAVGTIPTDPKRAVSDTVVAAFVEGGSLVSNSGGRTEKRNASELVRTVKQLALRDFAADKISAIGELVESLIWPFVARRSIRKEWFSDKEFRRFVSSVRKTATRIASVVSEDNREQTYIKFWLDTYLCQGFEDSQRPAPLEFPNQPLMVGWCKRFIARAVAQRDLAFLYSLQKGTKQMWPALGEVKKLAALKKHAERLSTYHGSTSSSLLEVIRMTSLRLFSRIGNRSGEKFMPSGSACLQASRREGGALSLFSTYNLPGVQKHPDERIMGKLPFLNATLNAWRQKEATYAQLVADQRLYADEEKVVPALDVEVQAIPEPGKFRIITKGDGYLYTALQPVQGQMLSAWKGHYASTMRTADLSDRVRQIDMNVQMPYWCSVDYEAATDLLKKDASLAALFGLTNSDSYEFAAASVLPGRAIYPDGTVIRSIEGQLMGHPLSFPCLCLINLSVYFRAVDLWVEADYTRSGLGKVMKRNVIVNGDDMLFKCDNTFYRDFFLPTANDAGFKISQGKQYLSEFACMINSQVFVRRQGTMKRVGYLNLRLVKGSALKTGESRAVPTMISRDLSAMALLTSWTECAIPAAMERWKEDWYGPRYRPNWYLPVHLGGVGLDVRLAPRGTRVTKAQREVAAMFIADPRLSIYRSNGMGLDSAYYAGALANWRMSVGDYVEQEHESFDLTDAWLERIAYAVRASHGDRPSNDKMFVSHFFPQYRLKPVSKEGLITYWHARWLAVGLPPCPPLWRIKVRELVARFGLSDEIRVLLREGDEGKLIIHYPF